MPTEFDNEREDLRRVPYPELMARYRRSRKHLDDPDFLELMAEIGRRGGDGDAAFLHQTERRTTFLGWLQLAGAAVLAYMIHDLPGTAFMVGILLVGLSATSGYMLLRRTAVGWWASVINQSMQLVAIQAGGSAWSYSAIGGIYLYAVGNGTNFNFGITASLDTSFALHLGTAPSGFGLFVDIVPAFFLFVLFTMRRLTRLGSVVHEYTGQEEGSC